MTKEKLLASVAAQQEHLFDLSCQIFDFNEPNGTEYKSSALCADELEKLGFTVERGIGNQETSFRAVWKNGEGGPNIGILASTTPWWARVTHVATTCRPPLPSVRSRPCRMCSQVPMFP